MKTAHLPGGRVLQFDDALSDKAIEAAVKAHLGVVDEPDDQSIDIEELLLEFVSVAKGLRTAIESMSRNHSQMAGKLESLAKSNNDVVKAVGAMAESLGESLGDYNSSVRDHAQNVADAHAGMADSMDAVTKRLYDLGRTVAEDRGELKALAAGFKELSMTVDGAAADVVKALKAPKTIRMNKEGRPIGLDVG